MSGMAILQIHSELALRARVKEGAGSQKPGVRMRRAVVAWRALILTSVFGLLTSLRGDPPAGRTSQSGT